MLGLVFAIFLVAMVLALPMGVAMGVATIVPQMIDKTFAGNMGYIIQAMVGGLTQRKAQLGVADPAGAAHKAFNGLLVKNATVLAFGDAFTLLALGCLIAAAASLFATPPKAAAAPPPSDSH